MQFNIRNILIIIAMVLIVGAAGFAIYYFFFMAPAAPPGVPEEEIEAPIGELPEAAEGIIPAEEIEEEEALPEASPVAAGGITQVETVTPTVTASNATLSGDGSGVQFYDPVNGQFNKVLPDGTIEKLSDQVFFGVDEVTWDGEGQSAILEYPDGSNIVYDFQTKKQVTLPKHWEDFDFSPQNDQIVAKSIGLDPDNRWLIVSDKDGANAQAIEPLGENADKVQVNWSPNNQVIATSRTGEPMGINQQQVLLVGKNHENFPGLVVEGWGFDYQWTPSGDRMVYDVYNMDNNYNPTLWVVDASGSNIGANRRYLKINTWAEKCTFSDNKTMYCAVPDYLPEGAGLQPELANDIPDTVYKIDLDTGRKTVVGKPADASTVSEMSITADGKYLMYVNQATGEISRMRLK